MVPIVVQGCMPRKSGSAWLPFACIKDAMIGVWLARFSSMATSVAGRSSAMVRGLPGPDASRSPGRVGGANMAAQDSKRRVALITGVTGQDGAYLAEYL